MALTHFFFPTSILLLSLLVIASAGDYGYDPKPDHTVKPEPNCDPKPKPPSDSPTFVYDKKPDHDQPKLTVPKPDTVHVDNGFGPDSELPKPKLITQNPNFEFDPKSNVEQADRVEPNGPIPKPDLPKPKLNDDKANYGYDLKPESPLPIGIEGLVLCKSGSSYTPVKGAMVRIACTAVDQNGYKTTPFSCLTHATNANGYYFQTLPPFELGHHLRITECKAYLESSPSETCKFPTDVNNGTSGALLSSYHILNQKNIKLYSMRPFFYTSQTASTPAGGY